MCGALVIDSMPPATTTEAEPALIRSWPSMIAFMPEPQTLLMVVAAGRQRQAGGDRSLARRRLAEVGRQHAAHDHFGDWRRG
jgi:endonuclease/exonuclease/phosphatase (EEP) superfamily protein YafD